MTFQIDDINYAWRKADDKAIIGRDLKGVGRKSHRKRGNPEG
jgi:hypothetical protein